MYFYVYSTYVHVCIVYVHYLWIHSMKAVFWHIEWITSGTHDAPCTVLTPIPHTQRYSRHYQQHEPAVYDSTLQASNHCQALPSDQLCQEIPTQAACLAMNAVCQNQLAPGSPSH